MCLRNEQIRKFLHSSREALCWSQWCWMCSMRSIIKKVTIATGCVALHLKFSHSSFVFPVSSHRLIIKMLFTCFTLNAYCSKMLLQILNFKATIIRAQHRHDDEYRYDIRNSLLVSFVLWHSSMFIGTAASSGSIINSYSGQWAAATCTHIMWTSSLCASPFDTWN